MEDKLKTSKTSQAVLKAYKIGYRVSESGLLIGIKGQEIKKTAIDNNGYRYVCVRIGKTTYKVHVHRIQAYQKYGMDVMKKEIVTRHLNGNPLDNSYHNIAIGTNSDNMMDIPESIRISKSTHASSFIKKHNKQEIKDFYNNVKSYKKTMDRFNISSKGTLHYIINS
jgi:hypothetical protein